MVEVLWKAVTSLLNRNLTAAITFHNILYGFWEGRGEGTAAIEAKLLQYIMDIREAVLFKIFFDLHKAYDALDQDR